MKLINFLLLLLSALSVQSLSAFTTYLDLGAWTSALTATPVTETFDADITEADSITFSGGIQSVGVNLIDGTGDNAVSGGAWSGNVRNTASANNGYTSITWTFTEPVNAFAADFSSIAGSRALEIVADWDASGESGINLRDAVGSGGFLGIIGESTFTEIRFDINEGTATIVGSDVFGIDNAATAVPEPSTYVLVVSLVAVGFIATRRRK
jgi:hypothetical protein